MDPWSKGDYSRDIREAIMAMEELPEVTPPSGRVPGQVFWRSRDRNRGGGGTVVKIA